MTSYSFLLFALLLHLVPSPGICGPLTPSVPYDWTDPNAPEFGWEPVVNGELGYFFGNVTCIPDYVDQGVSGNYGNCFDPAVGGTNSLWKSCVHVWLDDSKNKTDWRCMCHFTMHSRGNNCLWDWGAGSWWSNGFWFATCALVFFVDACKGVRLCYQMLQLKGFKLNAAITSCIFVTIALFSEAFRHSLYGPRNFPADHPLGLNGKQFDIGLYAKP